MSFQNIKYYKSRCIQVDLPGEACVTVLIKNCALRYSKHEAWLGSTALPVKFGLNYLFVTRSEWAQLSLRDTQRVLQIDFG